MVGNIPNSKFPLSSKHQANKKKTASTQGKNLRREKSAAIHSSLNVNKN